MAFRLGRLVGLACLLIVLLRLGRVLEAAAAAPDWRLVGGAAMLVGGLISAAGLVYHISLPRMAVVHVIGLLFVVVRITATSTLAWGFLPGSETLAAVGSELAYAVEILQFGAPPVLAVPGLTALVAVGLWLIGSAWAWGAVTGQVWLGILPPLGFYLYLSVMDRAPSGLVWYLALGTLAALGLLATTQVNRTNSGRVRDSSNRPLPRRRVGASAVIVSFVVASSLIGVSALGDSISPTGAIQWRNPGGAGDLGSGFSLNPFVGLRQSLLAEGEGIAFVAQVAGADGPPTRQMYWRTHTLDIFDGTFWSAGESDFRPVIEVSEWENPAIAYRGETTTVTQEIRIEQLRGDRLPSLYSAASIGSNDDVVRSGAEVNEDGSLRVNALTYQGMTYTVESEVPSLDVAALASEEGELTPLFEAAVAEGRLDVAAGESIASMRPAIITEYILLPPNMDPAIGRLAREKTAGASSPFEQAVLLEDFFLEQAEGFEYETQVSTGHSALDLAAWLTVPSSPNYRTGYCEQFATAMAVMGRLLDLPTRVGMGFTHGEYFEDQDLTVVRQKNAHAWVEIWFDEVGWVRFDPTPRGDNTTSPMAEALGFDPSTVDIPDDAATAGVDPLEQPGFEDLPNVPVDDLGVPVGGTGGGASLWLVAALVALAGAVALPGLKLFRRRRRRTRARQGDITAAWEETIDRLSDLGHGPAPHQTPLEFAAATDSRLVPLARAYSAAVYGGQEVAGVIGHLHTAEDWIEMKFDRRQRLQATFSSRSLTRR
ncbi:MAG TPA: DUF3488 and transglutaminase-like domain-containing protein [Acidimicrobiia bacterium]|nr:DUF3488 and transglutaminase-like domain-containing protein [Acidimicrobiia bacterium]